MLSPFSEITEDQNEEIQTSDAEQSQQSSTALLPHQQRIMNNLREAIVKQLGQVTFKKVYSFMREQRKLQVDDQKVSLH